MIKNYILDTNVLLQDPEAIYEFEDNVVIIPIGVLEELDKFKKDNTELGRNARQISRYLDDLRTQGDLRHGIPLETGGILKVRYNGNLESFYKEQNIDLHVIHIAQETIKKESGIPCIIVSRDINIRIRANALGLLAEDYEATKIQHDEFDTGFKEIEVDLDTIVALNDDRHVAAEGALAGYYPNCYFNVVNTEKKRSILAKVSPDGRTIETLPNLPNKLFIRSKNREQTFVLNALLDDSINLVCISGRAGTGKTLLAVAAGYYLTEVEETYDRLIICRPVTPLGKQDIGFLPGTIDEKLDPWMCPIYDAFDVIKGKNIGSGKKLVAESGKIQIEALTYIRGRSIHNQFIIVDECQNLTPLEAKTIITRVGEGTKLVLTGDVEQIDNPYVDKYSNGLTIVMDAFKDSDIAAHIVMTKGVRSKLAEEASRRL